MKNSLILKYWIVLFIILSGVSVASCRPYAQRDVTRVRMIGFTKAVNILRNNYLLARAWFFNVLVPIEHKLRERSVGKHGTVPAVILQDTDKLLAEARVVPRYHGAGYKPTHAWRSSYSPHKPTVVVERSQEELGSETRTMPTIEYRPFHKTWTKMVHNSITTNKDHVVQPAISIVSHGFPKWTHLTRIMQNIIQKMNQKTALQPSKHSIGAAAEESSIPLEFAENKEGFQGPANSVVPEVKESTRKNRLRFRHNCKAGFNGNKPAMRAENRDADKGMYYKNAEAKPVENWNPINPTLPQDHISRLAFMTSKGIQWIPAYTPIPKNVGTVQHDGIRNTDKGEYYENAEAKPVENWNPINPTLPQDHIPRLAFMTSKGIQWIPAYTPIPKTVGTVQHDGIGDTGVQYSTPG